MRYKSIDNGAGESDNCYMVGRIQSFFGDDFFDTFDSLLSAPGAFGNIVVATARQVRPVDVAAFSLVVLGWLWLFVGVLILGNHGAGLISLAVLPTLLWLAAGIAGGLVFEIGGLGKHVLTYWESYVLIGLFAIFGTIGLRLALNPKDRHVYRAPSQS